MKDFLFRLLSVLSVINLNAQEREEVYFGSASILTSYNKEVVEYKFKSLADLNLGLDEIIEEFDFKGKKIEKKEGCDITLMIRVEMSLGVASVVLSESITTLCTDENLGIVTKKLKRILTAMAID
ncbi:hypothetical protein [Flavobacterium sp.]|uniref:hypothetical protein n=1 Tax=Flavobacterium sp. TaxID=239 RepID=UPI002488BFBA|nr:hypothetical protein [Flavobacterium sp.]MDI1316740.1 hypothetical protein [Flavobacterium sp.]